MAVHLMLRYTSTGYPVRVFVNGFLLINDLAGERSGTRVEPYVLPGRNGLRLDTTQAERDASVTLQLVLIPDDGGADERVLLDLQYPDGGLSIGVVERSFELPAMLPRWAWANLQPAPAEANERSARVFLAELGGLIAAGPDEQLLALDAALKKLAMLDPDKARLVELRYFAGLTGDQAAKILGISPTSADRHWAYSRAWLRREIQGHAADREK